MQFIQVRYYGNDTFPWQFLLLSTTILNDNATSLLNVSKKFKNLFFDEFKNSKFTHISSASKPASLLQDLVLLGVWLQNFYIVKVITLDLRNCHSKEC